MHNNLFCVWRHSVCGFLAAFLLPQNKHIYLLMYLLAFIKNLTVQSHKIYYKMLIASNKTAVLFACLHRSNTDKKFVSDILWKLIPASLLGLIQVNHCKWEIYFFFVIAAFFLFKINRIEMQHEKFVEFGLALSFLTARKKSSGRKKVFKFHIEIWSNLLCFGAVWDVQPTAAEMPFAQIGASMRQRRRNGVKLVPGGGWARSTLQEVGRRNWIPARSKQQHLEGTGTGVKHDAFSQSNMS